jgi:hypothetical protein
MALFVLAAAYMRLGLFIPIDWMDEGQIVYPIWRVAMGEIPYREFQHLYGPSLFFFNGLLFRIFGSDLSVLRYSLLMIKAATCVMVYLAALRISGRTFAAIAYLLCVVMSGLAWVVSTNPYASFYAMALCLAGLLAFLWCERRILLGCAVAGLCFGLATTFKQTAGAFALIALALSLLTHDGNSEARPGKAFAILIRTSRWLVIIVTALVAAVYLYPRNPVWNLTLLLTPVLFLTGHLALRELRREPPPQSQLESFWGMVALAAGFSLPLLGYGLFYVSHGLGAELLFNTATVIPSVVSWFTPLPTPTPTFLLWQLALGGGFAAAVLFRRYSSESLVGFRRFAFGGFLGVSLLSFASLAVNAWGARNDDWWFWGSSDVLFSLPFALVWLSLVTMSQSSAFDVGSGANREAANLSVDDPGDAADRRRAFFLFTCYATMALLWLFPAGDIWHVIAILPSCLPLLAHQLERFWRLPNRGDRSPRDWQLGAGLAISVLVVALVLPAVRDLVRERGRVHAFAQPLPRAAGVVGDSNPYSSTRNGGKLIRYLNREGRRDAPIYILSSKQLFYFLTDRVSIVQEFEFVLYLAAMDLIPEESARELVDEDELIRRIKNVHPLIVDDDFGPHGENVKRMFPRLASFILGQYTLEKEFGKFRVLRWDPGR